MNIIRFPQMQLTSDQWVAKNPDVFFIATEQVLRRCSQCRKSIRAGHEYFGMYKIKMDRFLRSEDTSDITIDQRTVEMRLHPKCALELEGPAVRAKHG